MQDPDGAECMLYSAPLEGDDSVGQISAIVTLYSIPGKCILRAEYCTQIPEFVAR